MDNSKKEDGKTLRAVESVGMEFLDTSKLTSPYTWDPNMKLNNLITCTVAHKEVFKVGENAMWIRGEKFESTKEIYDAVTQFFTHGLSTDELKRGFFNALSESSYSRNNHVEELVAEYYRVEHHWKCNGMLDPEQSPDPSEVKAIWRQVMLNLNDQYEKTYASKNQKTATSSKEENSNGEQK